MTAYRKIAQIKDTASLRQRLDELGISLPIDDQVLTAEQGSVLAQPAEVGGLRIGNRWCIHPMEGWDANTDGSPTDLTLRRWERFGQSGAALIWGGEAAAVRPDGRANPNQTMAIASNAAGVELLRTTLEQAHRQTFGGTAGLVVGLQLTHSGRFCRPYHKTLLEPRIAYHHPLLDARFQIGPGDNSVVWTDTELDSLVGDYVTAAQIAQRAGFQFVDVKACHGYLLHEFLSAHSRPGPYGGDFGGRTRLLLSIIDAVRAECPGLEVGVRLSVFDMLPFEQTPGASENAGVGRPMEWNRSQAYDGAFGCSGQDPLEQDLREPIQLIQELARHGVKMINLTAGSPYYNPHIQRPAIFPPSDGYQPPEDPLVGVARQIRVAAQVKTACPETFLIGSGYTYLQDFLANVGQSAVAQGMIDSVGLGRMVLSYPHLPADVLAGEKLERKLICRTFSDCTSAPRQGMVSGCYPLDAFYKQRPERARLVELKKKS